MTTPPFLTMATKICTRCHQEKPLSEFSKRTGAPDGLQYTCRTCNKEIHKEYALKTRATTTPNGDPSYSHLNDREVQEQVKSLLNELRNRGWQVECSIAYLHTKKL